jgi:hypothetical protein
MKSSHIIAAAIFLLFSCKKEDKNASAPSSASAQPAAPVTDSVKAGLPAGELKINGYFYAARTAFSWSSNRYVVAFAAFSKTKKNLTVNYDRYKETNIIDTTGISKDLSDAYAGDIRFNTGIMNYLQTRPATYILVTFPDQALNDPPHWMMSGNMPFTALSCEVPRGFPHVKGTPATYTLTDGQDFVIALDSVSNYDSLRVSIQENATYKRFEKIVLPGAKTLTFPASEITQLNKTPGRLRFDACNYSTKAANSRLYLFELATKYTVDFEFKP